MSEHIEIPEQVEEDVLLPNTIRMFCATEIKAINKAEREVAHLITTTNPDRVGDVVEAAGADLGNYLKHPVVVANHSYRIEDIIGRAMSLTVEDGRIFARTKYRDTPLGRDAFNLASEGLGAWSIGFRPIKTAAMKDEKGQTKGFHFKTWELLEYSQVAIPMNPDAVQNAITRGLVDANHIKTFFRVEPSAEPCEKAAPVPNAEPARVNVHAPTEAAVQAIRRATAAIDQMIAIEAARERMLSAHKDM